MQNKDEYIEKLRNLLSWKKSKAFYAEKLQIAEDEIDELLNTIREKPSHPIEKPKARILLLDIEITPCLAYIYKTQVWKARVSPDKLISDWFMLTWAAKWVGDDYVMSDGLMPEEALAEDDRRIVESLWHLLNEAHAVIAHNGDVFDIPSINSRCVLHGMFPPSPYKQIDTLKVARTQFGFTHNSLEALAMFFGIEGKKKTDFQLWKDCIKGDYVALSYMEEYNKQDVNVLEKIYYRLRPYMKGHPNLDLYTDNEIPVCTTCGSDSLIREEGKYFYTQSVRYPLYRCSKCGSMSRGKKGEQFEYKKQVMSIPR